MRLTRPYNCQHLCLTGNISGRGRGQEREARGKRPRGTGGGAEERRKGGRPRSRDGVGRVEMLWTCHNDGVDMGHAIKRGERASGGGAVWRERRPESPLRDGRQGRDVGPPWGMAQARGEKRRPVGLGGSRTLGSGGNFGSRGPIWRTHGPQSFPHSQGFCSLPTPLAAFVRPVLVPCPMVAPRPRLVGRRGGGFLAVATARTLIHLMLSRPALLHAPWQRCHRGMPKASPLSPLHPQHSAPPPFSAPLLLPQALVAACPTPRVPAPGPGR